MISSVSQVSPPPQERFTFEKLKFNTMYTNTRGDVIIKANDKFGIYVFYNSGSGLVHVGDQYFLNLDETFTLYHGSITLTA